jgi:hypothetical protein
MKQIHFIALLVSLISFAQTQKESSFTNDSDTTYWMQYRNKAFDREDKSVTFFKLQTPCVSIEVFKTNGKVNGTIEFLANEVDELKDSTGVFKKKVDFQNSFAIFNLLDSSKINSIPSDKFIAKWQQGFDGITYIMEYKDSTQHSFKKYWTPSTQNNLEEAVRIQNFVDNVYSIVNLEKLSLNFQNEIPFRSWTCNGVIVTKVMSKKEYKEYKKKKRKFSKKKTAGSN